MRFPPRAGRLICAAGLELRDYRTLIEAVQGLDVRVVIASGSPWSTRPDTARGEPLPDNVEVCTLGFVDLRQLYADSRFVVMPLHDVEFQAGITTILEAMAMGKAVVCSKTRGQTDALVDGVTGIYVPPGDPGRCGGPSSVCSRILGWRASWGERPERGRWPMPTSPPTPTASATTSTWLSAPLPTERSVASPPVVRCS